MLILTLELAKVMGDLPRQLGKSLFRRRFVCVITAAILYDPHPWVAEEQNALKQAGADLRNLDLSALEPE